MLQDSFFEYSFWGVKELFKVNLKGFAPRHLLQQQKVWSCLTYHGIFWGAAAKSLQSCPTLCDPREGSPPGSPIPGILQARTLEWVAISFSNAWKWKVKVKSLSRVQLSATPYSQEERLRNSRGQQWGHWGLTWLLPSKLTSSKLGISPSLSVNAVSDV